MRIFASSRTVEGALDSSRQNNFDIMRFIAASFVIVSHSFAIGGAYAEPGLGTTTLGTFGVYIFFVMSGFLVTKSWDMHPRVTAFIGKRMLRIIPGLAGATLFVVLIIGPLFTSVSLAEYIRDPLTVAYFGNVAMFSLSYNLPGVFQHNSFVGSTNGPLWTLPHEFFAYICLAIFGYLGVLKRRFNLYFSLAGIIVVTYALNHLFSNTSLTILDLQLNYLVHNLAFFAMGVLIYQHRDRIVLSEQYAVLAFAVIALSPLLHNGQYFIRLIALSYLVIYLALAKSKHAYKFAAHGDISYGMYIYAWPVQQSVYALAGGHIGPLRVAAYSFPIVVILAAISWHLIERPFLKKKHIFSRERYPVI